MPDRSDVEQALAAFVAGVLYPSGSDSDSLIGNHCRIYRGWPVPGVLEAELGKGVLHVTVQPVAGTLQDRTRYAQDWVGVVPAPTLAATLSGETISFTGAGGAGQVAGISVDGRGYSYRMRTGDSASLVAAALAAQIRADRPALARDASVYLMNGRGLIGRVVADGQGGQELRRQESRFRVTFWCPDPATRDVVAPAVDIVLAGTTFLDVGGWACRFRLSGESSTDENAPTSAWRRDLVFSIEYPTVSNENLPAMLFGIADVNGLSTID